MPEDGGRAWRPPLEPRHDRYARRSPSPRSRDYRGRSRERDGFADGGRRRSSERRKERDRGRSGSPYRHDRYDSYKPEIRRSGHAMNGDGPSSPQSFTTKGFGPKTQAHQNGDGKLDDFAQLQSRRGPTKMPNSSENSDPEGVVVPPTLQPAPQIQEIFTRLVVQAAQAAAVTADQIVAKKTLSDRKTEFERSKDQHAKFPTTEIYQINAIKKAEKQYNSASNSVQDHTQKIEKSTIELLSTMLPYLIDASKVPTDKTETRKLEDRLEKMYNSYQTLESKAESQQTLIRDLTRKLEDSQIALQKDREAHTASVLKLKQDIAGCKQDYNDQIQKLSTDLSTFKAEQSKSNAKATRDLLTIQVIKDEKVQLQKDVAALQGRVISIENKPQQSSNPVNDAHFTSLGNRVESIQQTLNVASSKFEAIEKMQTEFDRSVKHIQARISTAETTQSTTTMQLGKAMTAKSVKEVVENETRGVKDRTHSIEKMVEEWRASRQEISRASTRDAVANSKQIKKLELRVSAMETTQGQLDFQSRLEDVNSQIAALERSIKEVKAGEQNMRSAVTDTIFNTVNSTVDDEIAPRFSAYDEKLNQLERSVADINIKYAENETSRRRDLAKTISAKVITELQANPSKLPGAPMDHELAMLQKRMNDLYQEILALQNGFGNHEARMNNINTGQLAKHMLDSLRENSVFKKTEVDLQNLTLNVTQNFQEVEKSLKSTSADVAKINRAITALETRNSHPAADDFANLKLEIAGAEKRMKEIADLAIQRNSGQLGMSTVAMLETITTVDNKIKRLDSDFGQLQTKVQTIVESQASFSQLRNEVSSLKGRTDGLHTAVQIRDLEASIEEIKKTLQSGDLASTQEITSLNGQIAGVQKQMEDLTTEHDKSMAQITADIQAIKATRSKSYLSQTQRGQNGKTDGVSRQVSAASSSEPLYSRSNSVRMPDAINGVRKSSLANQINGRTQQPGTSSSRQSSTSGTPAPSKNRSADPWNTVNGSSRNESPVRSDLVGTDKKRKLQYSAPNSTSKGITNGPARKKFRGPRAFIEDSDEGDWQKSPTMSDKDDE